MAVKHPQHSSGKQRNSVSGWERVQMMRLLCALVLFLAVFAGKQIYPEKVLSVGEEVVAVLASTTDFEAAFSRLGQSLNAGSEVLKGVEAFCVEVFGSKDPPESSAVKQASLPQPQLPTVASAFPIHTIDLCQFKPVTSGSELLPSEPVVAAVGTVLTVGKHPEQALPAGYTMDELSFGELDTVNPVFGRLNSKFGYRDHPVSGTHCFHGGADISANAGDPIAAFADGTVEYIGEDSSYGLYFQLDHGHGIKSFYAHCQSICVKKGQQVTAGETVAKVGSSGTATGPHLHLELKCGSLRVDPSYYIEFMDAA